MKRTPDERSAHAPPPPPAAAEIFGGRIDTVRSYADLLVSVGVERGLIGPREVDRVWDRHVLNSVALVPLVPAGADVLDVGSGAGLPGIPLALARPDLQVTLVEPLLRRTTFLTEVCRALSLEAVEVVRSRAEDLPTGCTDVVVARAVAPLVRLVPWTLPLLRPGGRLVALKGRSAADEIDDAVQVLRRYRARSWRVHDLPVPGCPETTRAVVVDAGDSSDNR